MLDSTPKTTTDFWDAQWGERGSRDTLSAWLHRDDFGKNGHFLRLMDRHMPNLFEGARVCELGGASSKFLVDLALYRGAVVTAVDYSPIGIEQTKALCRDSLGAFRAFRQPPADFGGIRQPHQAGWRTCVCDAEYGSCWIGFLAPLGPDKFCCAHLSYGRVN
jgi:hypothetical protein